MSKSKFTKLEVDNLELRLPKNWFSLVERRLKRDRHDYKKDYIYKVKRGEHHNPTIQKIILNIADQMDMARNKSKEELLKSDSWPIQ